MLDLSQPKLLNQTSLPFNDARSCKDWLNGLPLADGARGHRLITEVIDSLNLTEMAGFERLKIMELLRDKVAFLQEQVRGSFAGKPVPLATDAWETWKRGADLWQGMEQGYHYSLRAAANGDADTAKHFALIIERCLCYNGMLIIHYGLAHTDVPSRLLQDTHLLFQYAEQRGLAHTQVKDSLDGHRGMSTPALSYVRTLLMEVSEARGLTGHELLAIDALLKKWAAKVVISRIPPEGEPGTLRCADLAGEKGLRAPIGTPAQRDTLVYFDLKALSESLRRRIRKLAAGVAWSELSLPTAFASVHAAPLLTHIYRCWCEAQAAETLKEPARDKCEVVSGFEGLYHALTGKSFEAPRQADGMGTLEAQQLAVFGKVMPRQNAGVTAADPSEQWKLEGASANRLRLRRPVSSHIALGLQQLIGYRGAAMPDYALALVQGLTDQGSSGLVIDAVPWQEKPEGIIFRAKGAAFQPGLRLPISEEGAVNFVFAPGVFAAGKVVEVRNDAIQMYRLTAVTQRGANFECVSAVAL